MALFRLGSGEAAGFGVLFSLAVMYGVFAFLTYSVTHMKFITPLGFDAPLDRFSEARAVEHVRVLAHDIGGRQEGNPGLRKAAVYIKSQLELIKERAGPNVRIEIEETDVNGTFSMKFLGHIISTAYRNHTNILMRISSVDSQENNPSVLINGHFDSPPNSPGAGDCGSCVASMLELARLSVDSAWIPRHPVIFLFNGAEELFLLGSHGFMTTHRWSDTLGAAIDVEASGTGGTDLVCQSGPGSWPSHIYAQSAIHPMANSAAQDFFGAVPGDTDYRMFAQDYGDVPGLDIIFLLGGYFYHTSSDTVERLLPGSIQARGDNLFSLLKAFTNSPMLKNAYERESLRKLENQTVDESAVFFDYFSRFLVFYPRRLAVLLHNIPTAIFFLMPICLQFSNRALSRSFITFYDFVKGMLHHALAIVLAIIFPVIFAILRLLFSGISMNWFSNPFLAYMMFIPCSIAGLLVPRLFWRKFPLSQDVLLAKSSKEVLAVEARFWGAFGLYSFMTLGYFMAGFNGGFLTFLLALFMLPAWMSFRISAKFFGNESLRSLACYVIPLLPCLAYSVYFGGFLSTFLIEKMGMTGSFPPPYGYFISDSVVAATVGLVTGWCVGPLIPVVGHWLARKSIVQFLLHGSIIALAISSQFFPYSTDAPKRVVMQHTIRTKGVSQVQEASYEFSVVDSNSLHFVFKHAPEAARELNIDSDLSSQAMVNPSQRQTWMGVFPISYLFSGSMKFSAGYDDVLKEYSTFPALRTYKPQDLRDDGSRRIHLELSHGSIKEMWVSVLNITGPLSGWSFTNGVLPAPETVDNGPPSHMIRLTGASHENWTFWLEARSSEPLTVEVAVVSLHLSEAAAKLKGLFPKWMDITPFSSFASTYVL